MYATDEVEGGAQMKGCPDCEKRKQHSRNAYYRNPTKRKAQALAYYYKYVRPAKLGKA